MFLACFVIKWHVLCKCMFCNCAQFACFVTVHCPCMHKHGVHMRSMCCTHLAYYLVLSGGPGDGALPLTGGVKGRKQSPLFAFNVMQLKLQRNLMRCIVNMQILHFRRAERLRLSPKPLIFKNQFKTSQQWNVPSLKRGILPLTGDWPAERSV